MNNTIKELFDRKSVRAFTDREISKEDRELILNAACQAPSAGNQQMYTIIDVQSHDLKTALVKTCDNQPMIAEAKMVLVFCADMRKWYEAFEELGLEPRKLAVGDLLLAVTDTCIAAQNAVVAAQSLGIGSCYIGDIMENCEKQRELLKLPKYVFPAAMLIFGYPTQQQADREKPERAPLNRIVSVDSYPEMDKAYREDLFKYKASNLGYDEYMKAFCNRKYNSDFSKEMSRSVYEYLKDFLNEE